MILKEDIGENSKNQRKIININNMNTQILQQLKFNKYSF